MLPLHLQPESRTPPYLQLRDQLRALVHSGELRGGDRIPASGELAVHLGVHPTTVATGLIRGHVGRGTFICLAPIKQFSPPSPSAHGAASLRWESLFADERSDEGMSRLAPVIPP